MNSIDVVDAARDDVDRQQRAGASIDLRPHGDDPHVVGQRGLEAVEAARSTRRCADRSGRWPGGVGGRRLDLLRIDGRAQARRPRAQIGGARFVARRPASPAACRCASTGGRATTLNSRRRERQSRARRRASSGPRARCRTDASRDWSGSCGRLSRPAAAARRAAPACRAAPARRRSDRSSAAAVRRIDRLDRRAEPLLEAAAQSARRRRPSRPPTRRRRGARARSRRPQAILVVHRRLVHEIGERPVGVGGAVAEEDHVRRRAGSRSTRSRSRRSRAASRRRAAMPASTALTTLKRRQIDDARR